MLTKIVLGVTIGSKEIECADKIVSESGIYKAVVVSVRAEECLIAYPFDEVEILY